MIVPNYMTGSTRRFKNFPTVEEQLLNRNQEDNNDIFIYNDHNEKGGRNGIACIALAIGEVLLGAENTSVMDPEWFIPDPALNFPSSGSGFRQKFRVHADPDPNHVI